MLGLFYVAYSNWYFQSSLKRQQILRAIFARKFAAKKFQKSPNQVTLAMETLVLDWKKIITLALKHYWVMNDIIDREIFITATWTQVTPMKNGFEALR